jgi:hypothetical protein
VSIDTVPRSLRPSIVVKRAKSAVASLNRLLAEPVPGHSSGEPVDGLMQHGKRLLELNRHAGVLENTVVALREFQRTGSMPRRKIGRLLKTCVKTAIATEGQFRQTLEHMAGLARQAGSDAKPDSPEAMIALKKAELYDSLRESRAFQGTSLEHPFLSAAVKKIRRRAQASSPGKAVSGAAQGKP